MKRFDFNAVKKSDTLAPYVNAFEAKVRVLITIHIDGITTITDHGI
jgi:hypothetical protein